MIDFDRLTVRYDSPFALMHDLRAMGATNVLSERRRKPLKRATLFRMAEIYAQRFADADGRLRATFEVAWLSGWAPHESQQKPLKPGSATQRLADALGTQGTFSGREAGWRKGLIRLPRKGGSEQIEELVVEQRLDTGPESRDGADNRDADAGSNERVFDCSSAFLRGQETDDLGTGDESGAWVFLLGTFGPGFHSSAIRWDTSGTSAGGMS